MDELNTVLGFARSICHNQEIAGWTEQIQKDALPAWLRFGRQPPESRKAQPYITAEDVDFLTELVYQIEATEGILADWSLPGAHTESAAYERSHAPSAGVRSAMQYAWLRAVRRLSRRYWHISTVSLIWCGSSAG